MNPLRKAIPMKNIMFAFAVMSCLAGLAAADGSQPTDTGNDRGIECPVRVSEVGMQQPTSPLLRDGEAIIIGAAILKLQPARWGAAAPQLDYCITDPHGATKVCCSDISPTETCCFHPMTGLTDCTIYLPPINGGGNPI